MPDTSDVAIPHLQKRKIEGGVLIRFIETLRERVGQDAAREIVDETIRKLAAEDGAKWAQAYGRGTDSLRRVAEDVWSAGGGMDVEIVRQSDDRLDFNVTRCGYAAFYKELGLADIGYTVQCKRDFAMLAGFNGELDLQRSQTIMEGAACCDFSFRKKD